MASRFSRIYIEGATVTAERLKSRIRIKYGRSLKRAVLIRDQAAFSEFTRHG